MKLTRTQRNFKKEMAKLHKSSSPYENDRDGNPFLRDEKTSAKFVSPSLLIIIAILCFMGYAFLRSPLSNFPKNLSAVKTVQSTFAAQTNISTLNTVKTVSSSDSRYIQTTKSFITRLNDPWSKVSEQHAIPWDKRNISEYRTSLLNGISACDQSLLELDAIKSSVLFGSLTGITKQYISYSKLAFKSFLDYTYTKSPSDLTLGNNYVNQANQSSAAIKSTLIQIFKQNGYSYEQTGDGQIRYSVRDN